LESCGVTRERLGAEQRLLLAVVDQQHHVARQARRGQQRPRRLQGGRDADTVVGASGPAATES
jgi:hypothetical protein